MSEVPNHDHQIDTGKSVLSLDELGAVQPGLARLMPEIGGRIWKCYYAGKAGNRALAAFELKEAVNLMEMGVLLRPKYMDSMYSFIEDDVSRIASAIEAEDWAAFEEAFEHVIGQANAYHELYEKGFLRWKMPSMPPPDMDLTPRPA
jgi:hypothetical protein